MTEIEREARELLAVTQGDRDAAAAAVKAYRGGKNNDWAGRIQRGQCDDGEMVQAFARHRIAALTRHPLRSGEGVEQLLDEVEDGLTWNSSGFQSLKRIEQIIRKWRSALSTSSSRVSSDGTK